ncbi:hypothetical protein [Burkholderia lata]|uniref:hypothetical protein n=1 Tax=Burkholderia lata (strain ATCC 17760 / DSM 23089 / LMG 22485 / NCIMB 9086 / R18194 / 383) TaxID=482957 RepID=UPI001582163D|nr:hypothetical protein [Burkholderia lata]
MFQEHENCPRISGFRIHSILKRQLARTGHIDVLQSLFDDAFRAQTAINELSRKLDIISDRLSPLFRAKAHGLEMCIGKRKRFTGMRIGVARGKYVHWTRISARHPQAEHLPPTVDRRDV